MTLQEQFEKEFTKQFHVANVRVHHWTPGAYTTPMDQPSRRRGGLSGGVQPARPGTLRFKVTELLKAAPNGLTVPEIRQSVDVTANAIAGLLWVMTKEYGLTELAPHRLVGNKNCRVYRWIA